MQNRQELEQDLQLVQTLEEMVQAYEEIYVIKMQKIRNAVLSTRHFMGGMATVYGEVKAVSLRKQREKKPSTFRYLTQRFGKRVLPQKTKKVAVLLTGSQRLSGDINLKVHQYFIDFVKENPNYNIVVVGSVGKTLMSQREPDRQYQYFDLSEDQLTIEELKPVVDFILQFDQVEIFYGKFISLVQQQQTRTNLSGAALPEDQLDPKGPNLPPDFIFEPSLDKLTTYFENQIFASLYKQTAHESYLAQLGSRITALESASSNIKKRLHKIRLQERKWHKRIRNKKQLQAIAGITLWGKK